MRPNPALNHGTQEIRTTERLERRLEQEVASAIEALIATSTSEPHSKIVNTTSISGGSINSAFQVILKDGRRFFVKSNSVELVRMFECEAAGLRELERANAIRIPEVIGVGTASSQSFLVLELIDSAEPKPEFSREMGTQLAILHQTRNEKFGFQESNFLGSSNQPNDWNESWPEFWAQCRLGFQLKLARDQGNGDRELQQLGDRLLGKLESRLRSTEQESPALLHGDLWSGNYISGTAGEPVFVDPAVYFGSREAEFGMTTLFGGFDADFYDAYNEVSPLAEGSTDRIAIYRIYHLLNHLNLFGNSYLSGCLEILKKYA